MGGFFGFIGGKGGKRYPKDLALLWNASDTLSSRVGPNALFGSAAAVTDGQGGTYAANVPAVHDIDGRKLMWNGPSYTNKVTCRKANPVDTANVLKAGDAASVLSVVDDTAALAAAGLSGICTSGKVYKLDNSLGVDLAYAIILGAAGNLNTHIMSVYARTSATASLYSGSTDANHSTPVTGATYNYYKKIFTPMNTPATAGVLCGPNSVVYFILPQLVESPYLMPLLIAPGDPLSAASSASAAGTTGGNGLSWPMVGSSASDKLKACFEKTETDGVELWGSNEIKGINWTLTDGWWVHTPGNGGSLYDSVLTINSIYKISYEVRNYSAGTIQSIVGAGTGVVRSSNGVFTEILTCISDVSARFMPSLDFAGEIRVLMVQKIKPSVMSAAALVRMGVGSAEMAASTLILSARGAFAGSLYCERSSSDHRIVRFYDDTAAASSSSEEWYNQEYHRKVVQTNALGTQYRVGNQRLTSEMIPINPAIVWGAWVNYDGSFSPLNSLIAGLFLTVPHWISQVQVWQSSASEADILKWFNKYYPQGAIA